jgi:Tfp pilus assembly protein PilO
MKVKILLIPLLAVIAIGLLVWLVYPAYSNGADGFKEKYNVFKKEKQQIKDINDKKQNAEAMASQLSGISSEKEVLYNFIPENAKEEEIIDNLNFLASSKNSLSILSFSMSQSKTENSPENFSDATSPENSELSDTALNNATAAELVPMPLPKTKNFEVGLKVAGNYENIRNFLVSIGDLKRYGSLSSLNISASKEENGELSSVLLAEIKIDFNTLKKTKLAPGYSIDNSIFSSGQLDMGAISLINESRNTNLLKLNVGSKGKSNPFLP